MSEEFPKYVAAAGPSICLRCGFRTNPKLSLAEQGQAMFGHLNEAHPSEKQETASDLVTGWEDGRLDREIVVDSRYSDLEIVTDGRLKRIFICEVRHSQDEVFEEAEEPFSKHDCGRFDRAYIEIKKSDRGEWSILVNGDPEISAVFCPYCGIKLR